MPKKSEKKPKENIKEKKSSKKVLQSEVNIGLVGHVDHGKTTLTEKLSGKWTDTHSEELKRGITIKLGYADASFYRCTQCRSYTTKEKCPKCSEPTKFLRKVSFVDAPGHESLMATMLAGTTIMDGALLLIAADEKCPQPQTREHLMALQIIGIKNIIIVQNKIDLVDEQKALENYAQIKEFLKETPFKDAPIIPISSRYGVNIDLLVEAIEKYIPAQKHDSKLDPRMFVARSFDINRPGTLPENLVGGVLGGAIVQGTFKVNDKIEIRPGIVEKGKKAKPLFTKIIDIKTAGQSVSEITPGGSIGILTSLDPGIVRADNLLGNIVGHPGKLPEILDSVVLETKLLDRVLGTKEDLVVEPIKMNELLMLNVNSAATVGVVDNLSKHHIRCRLKLPICAEYGSRVTISRRIGIRFRLIGYGVLKKDLLK